MKNYQRGFIGNKEIELAITELESLSWKKDENLFIHSDVGGRIISCWWYKDLEELLEDNQFIDTYKNTEDYISQMLEIDEDYIYNEKTEDEALVSIFKEDKTAYKSSCGNSGVYFYDDNKDEAITDFLNHKHYDVAMYTFDEAIKNLKSDYQLVDEDLVISLLS